MINTMTSIKIWHKKLKATITVNILNRDIKLYYKKFDKILKMNKCFCFIDHQKDPFTSRKIIHYGEKVSMIGIR